MWKLTYSNRCPLVFSQTASTTHMKIMRHHESGHLHNFIVSALEGTLNPRLTSFKAIKPPLFFRQTLEEGAWYSLDNCQARLDKRLPDGKTPWHGRTEKVQNCAKKLPNVLSEILEKQHFSTIFRQLLLPTVVLPYKKKEPKNGLMFLLNPQHLPTANHHASEGPATSKTEPKNANTGTCRQQITMPLKDQLLRKPNQKTP